MTKFQAINYLNKQLGKEVFKNSNTNFSNINSRRNVWWMNIKLERLKEDFNILLIGEDDLHWLKIPANSFNPQIDFRIWEEKNAIDLYLSSDKNDRFLKDISSGARGVDFKPFVVKVFPIPDTLKSQSNKEELSNSAQNLKPVRKLNPEVRKQRILVQDQTNITYDKLFGESLKGAENITLQDPWIRLPYQFQNLLEFCVMLGNNIDEPGKTISLKVLSWNTIESQNQSKASFEEIAASVKEMRINLTVAFEKHHDRFIKASNGCKIILGRGLDIYEKREGRFSIGDVDQRWRKCKPCEITYIKENH